jgi:CRP-like cAMP-binding protein
MRPLPMATLAQLATRVSSRELEPGSVMIEEGSSGDDFNVIVHGRAEVLLGRVSVAFLGRAAPRMSVA